MTQYGEGQPIHLDQEKISFSNIILELILILRFWFSDKVLLTELSVLDICLGNFDKLFSDNYISKPNALWKYSL